MLVVPFFASYLCQYPSHVKRMILKRCFQLISTLISSYFLAYLLSFYPHCQRLRLPNPSTHSSLSCSNLCGFSSPFCVCGSILVTDILIVCYYPGSGIVISSYVCLYLLSSFRAPVI